MEKERTFIMIKPDGVQRGLIGKIISRFEKKGFKLVAMKFMQVINLIKRSCLFFFCSNRDADLININYIITSTKYKKYFLTCVSGKFIVLVFFYYDFHVCGKSHVDKYTVCNGASEKLFEI